MMISMAARRQSSKSWFHRPGGRRSDAHRFRRSRHTPTTIQMIKSQMIPSTSVPKSASVSLESYECVCQLRHSGVGGTPLDATRSAAATGATAGDSEVCHEMDICVVESGQWLAAELLRSRATVYVLRTTRRPRPKSA